MRTLNKGLNGVAPKPVSGYVSGVTEYLEADTGIHATYFDVDVSMTAATWESIGPTGSGATNIWTPMDSIPLSAKWIKLKAYLYFNTSAGAQTISLHGRATGSVIGFNDTTRHASFTVEDGLTAHSGGYTASCVEIPLSSSNTFDIGWSGTATFTSEIVRIWQKGWGG